MRNSLLLLVPALLFSSCSAPPPQKSEVQAHSSLPVETTFNNHAGSGDRLFVTLRLDDGQRKFFCVDTGSPTTILDRSMVPKLGKSLGKRTLNYAFHLPGDAEIYAPPKLFLGGTELQMGKQVMMTDLRKRFSMNADGILGMDCLVNYCLQLDFQNGKLRLIDPDKLDTNNIGRPFPLSIRHAATAGFTDGVLSQFEANLHEKQNYHFWVETSFSADGDFLIRSEDFNYLVREHKPEVMDKWNFGTNRPDAALFSNFEFAGNSYSNIVIGEVPVPPGMNFDGWAGLRFFSRHLVTLNFPKGVMYLKQISMSPRGSYN